MFVVKVYIVYIFTLIHFFWKVGRPAEIHTLTHTHSGILTHTHTITHTHTQKVKAGHIAQNEEEEFIQQANRILTSITRSRTDSTTKDNRSDSVSSKDAGRDSSKPENISVDTKPPSSSTSSEATPLSPSLDPPKTSNQPGSLKVSTAETSLSTQSTPSHESQAAPSGGSARTSVVSESAKSKNGVALQDPPRGSHTPEPVSANKQGSPPIVASTKDASTSTSITSTSNAPVEETAAKMVCACMERSCTFMY